MNRKQLKALILATAGIALAQVSLQAQAVDMTVVDGSSFVIHPYFKSNCWGGQMKVNNPDPKKWVFFGGIAPGTQFTWSPFEDMIDPKCRNPKVSFTFVLDGEPAPTDDAKRSRTVKLDFDATVPVYTIDLGNKPVVTTVTPADDDEDKGRHHH